MFFKNRSFGGQKIKEDEKYKEQDSIIRFI